MFCHLHGFYRIFAHIAAALRAFLCIVSSRCSRRVRTEPFAWHRDENGLASHLDAGSLPIGVAVLLRVLLGGSRFIYRASDKN